MGYSEGLYLIFKLFRYVIDFYFNTVEAVEYIRYDFNPSKFTEICFIDHY